MRDHLDEVAGRQPLQHRAAQRDLPAVLEHAHLAPVLGLVRRRRLLERVRRRLVDRAPAGLHHPVREREVVPPPRVDLDVVRAPHRVDRAVAARDRAEPRLGLALGQLVAPVDALLVRAVGAPRARAGRRRRRPPDRRSWRRAAGARRAPRSRSRPRRRRSRRSVSRTARFCAATLPPRGLTIRRTPVAEALDELVRAVGRGVRGDDDARACRPGSRARAGSRAGARSPAPRCRRRRSRSRAARSRPCARARVRTRASAAAAERVDGVRPEERAEREPEERLEHEHGASVERPVGSAACRLASALSSARGRTS